MVDRARGSAPREPVDDEQIRTAVPPQSGGREARVGIFVLLGILSAIAVLFVMTDPATLRGRYMLVTPHEDAGGIRRGDPVQMRGVNIGRIHGFEMVGGRVDVTMEIEGAWEIPEDSYTRLAGMGLFGGRTMEIIPGVSARAAAKWDTLPSDNGAIGIIGTAEAAAEQATHVLDQLTLLVADPTVATVRRTTEELLALSTELREMVAVQQQQFGQLTASLMRSAAELETATGAAPDVVRAAARADTVMAQLALTGVTLDHAAGLLDDVLTRLHAGEGTLGRLTRDDALYVNLNRAAEAVALLADDIRENPRRYIQVSLFGFR